MRILAIDYGSTRIGLALSDPDRHSWPVRYPSWWPRAMPSSHAKWRRLAAKEEAGLLLLGLPRHMNDDLAKKQRRQVKASCLLESGQVDNAADQAARRAADQPSSQGASCTKPSHDTIRQKERIDSFDSAIKLQSYLDATAFPAVSGQRASCRNRGQNRPPQAVRRPPSDS